MRDGYTDLPLDDESPATLKKAGTDYLEQVLGYEAEAGDLIDADLAFTADETAALWAALRQKDTDTFRDQGRAFGVADPAPVPAVTTLTLTAGDTAGHTLDAGATAVVRGATGDVTLQSTADAVIAPGQSAITGVLFQAIDPEGADANGAGASATTLDGSLELASPPSWLASATVETPTANGQSALTDEEHDAQIKRAILLTQQTPTHVDDLELAAQQVPGVDRMLVIKGLDLAAGTLNNANVATGFPIDPVGAKVNDGVKQLVRVRCLGDTSRLLCQRDLQLGDPTYWTINADVLIRADDGGVLRDALKAAGEAALTEKLQPYNHALPRVGTGQLRRWMPGRTVVRRYELASTADQVPGCDEVLDITLSATGPNGETAQLDADGNVLMTGWAPLTLPGTITVTVQ